MMKTFFVDIDGVIYKNKKLNLEVIKSIQNNNYRLIFCTGRGYLRSLDVIKDYLDNDSIIIIENGSKIVDYKGKKLIFKNILSQEKEIIKEINPEKIDYILFNPNNSKKYISYSKINLKHVKVNYDSYQLFCDELLKNNITQITIKFKNQIYKNNFKILCQKKGINYKLSEDYLIINAKDISKKSAILFCMNKYNMKNDDIVIIGNDYNDLEMFDVACDYKIAVVDENTPNLLIEKSTISTNFDNLSKVIKNIS